jgi:predicted PurR-regulated permease PerM
LVVAIVVALLILLWALSEILLLIFAAVLLAVLLRAIAALVAVHIRADERWPLLLAAAVLFGIIAAAVFLFGRQIWAQLQALGTQLHAVEDTLTGYVGQDRVRELLGSGSVGALFAHALSWGTTAMAAAAGVVLVVVAGIYLAIRPAVYREGFIKLFPIEWHARIGATLDDSNSALRLWLGAQLIAMAIVGVLVGLWVLLLGIPSPLALGLIFAVSEFVPVVGPIIGAIPVRLSPRNRAVQNELSMAELGIQWSDGAVVGSAINLARSLRSIPEAGEVDDHDRQSVAERQRP